MRELQSAAPPTFLLGGTGHLILSTTEKKLVEQRLASEILPQVMSVIGHRTLHILTGLAPGSDHLFSHTTVAYARAQKIPHRLVGLLPLPIAVMLDDWAERMQTEGQTVTQAQRDKQLADMEAERLACDRVVHLMPPGTSEDSMHELVFRQLQYQRLAACLAEQSDVLIAILRPDSLVQPGGTAEVVKWRQQVDSVPAAISTFALRSHSAARGGSLFIINPEFIEKTS